jgi:type VI secretion system secreted protein Hcp
MAHNVSLFLKVNGQDIQGENAQVSLGRENSIECFQFIQQGKVLREASTGQATGRRQYDPIVIVKRLDKSSPLLARALAQNQPVSGVFKFFRPNPSGDGTDEHFYAVEFKDGRIAALKEYMLDTLDPTAAAHPPLEEVSFVFNKISWTHVSSGVSFEDSVSGR